MDKKKVSFLTSENEPGDSQGAIKRQCPPARMTLRLKQVAALGLATGLQWLWNQHSFQHLHIGPIRMRHSIKLCVPCKRTWIHHRKHRPLPVTRSAPVVF